MKRLAVSLAIIVLVACGGSAELMNQADTQAPRLVDSIPAAGSADVAAFSELALGFSEPMRTHSVVVSLSPKVQLQSPRWMANDTQLVVAPVEPLLSGTTYQVTVGGLDQAGNALGLSGFSFTTGKVDVTAPSWIGSVPVAQATRVPTDTKLELRFSKSMDIGRLRVATLPEWELGEAVWADDNKKVTFPAAGALTSATAYSVSFEGADDRGTALTGAYSFTFVTAEDVDTLAPSVAATTPSDGASQVLRTTTVTLQFSEPMEPTATLAALSFQPSVRCAFKWNDTRDELLCTPEGGLTQGEDYVVTLAASAKDRAGNELAQPFVFRFSTKTAADTTAPRLLFSYPADNAVGVSTQARIVLTFSEPMDRLATQRAFRVTAPSSLAAGAFSWNTAGTQLVFDPTGVPLHGATVTFELSAGAVDLAQNPLSPLTRSFRVVRQGISSLDVAAGLDGYVTSLGSWALSTPLVAGDTGWNTTPATNFFSKSFMSFDLGGLPTNVTAITQATLYVYQSSTAGNPYGKLGPLVVDSVNYGESLEFADFDLPTLHTSSCTAPGKCTDVTETRVLSTSAQVGWKSALTTAKVQSDWQLRASRGRRSQFRLRFSSNLVEDQVTDQAIFLSGESAQAYRPKLVVTYEYP